MFSNGFELRGGGCAVFLGEEDVVVLIALERRIEIDEVNRMVLDVAAEDFEVIAVVKVAHAARNDSKSGVQRGRRLQTLLLDAVGFCTVSLNSTVVGC